MIQMSKISLRKSFKKLRENLSNNEVKNLSALVNTNLINQNEYKEASNIGYYYPINNEVFINTVKGKIYSYQKINGNKLNFFNDSIKFSVNQYGIKEPANSQQVQLDELDICLVPLIAFNDKLFRIGYGGGFYDQTFSCISKSKKKPILIGLGYDFLKSEINFQTQEDVRLDKIITEKGIYV